jgi:hypothetical protein
MNVFARIHPLVELIRMFRTRRNELRFPKQISEELAIGAYQDAARDIQKSFGAVALSAHKGKVYDEEATALLDGVLADGRVDPSEIHAIKKARAMAHHSARCDSEVGKEASGALVEA